MMGGMRGVNGEGREARGRVEEEALKIAQRSGIALASSKLAFCGVRSHVCPERLLSSLFQSPGIMHPAALA